MEQCTEIYANHGILLRGYHDTMIPYGLRATLSWETCGPLIGTVLRLNDARNTGSNPIDYRRSLLHSLWQRLQRRHYYAAPRSRRGRDSCTVGGNREFLRSVLPYGILPIAAGRLLNSRGSEVGQSSRSTCPPSLLPKPVAHESIT